MLITITGDDSNSCMGLSTLEEAGDSSGGRGNKESSPDNPKLSPKIAVMEPVLRFLQLLCENHNLFLQVCILLVRRGKLNER